MPHIIKGVHGNLGCRVQGLGLGLSKALIRIVFLIDCIMFIQGLSCVYVFGQAPGSSTQLSEGIRAIV